MLHKNIDFRIFFSGPGPGRLGSSAAYYKGYNITVRTRAFYAIITKGLADSLPLWHIGITFDGSLHRSVSEEAGTLAFCQGELVAGVSPEGSRVRLGAG